MDVETTFEWDLETKYSITSQLSLTVYESVFAGINASEIDIALNDGIYENIDTYEELLEQFDGNVTEAEEAFNEEFPSTQTIT